MACAPVFPALSGGAITPSGRVDTVAGAAVRIPHGKLRSCTHAGRDLRVAQPGGIAPLIAVRTALTGDLDLGLKLSPVQAQLEGRFALKLGEDMSLIGGVAPYGGWLSRRDQPKEPTDSRLAHLGFQAPLVVALSVQGVYQAWAGARIGYEYVWGKTVVEGRDANLLAKVVRPGALLGFGLGFRRLWALIEVAADYEWWSIRQAGLRRSPNGIALTPAFALQLRF